MEQYPQFFSEALRNKEAWRIQVIYTQIDRDKTTIPNSITIISTFIPKPIFIRRQR
ncbi:MAG TPA: hypothetical protein VER36_07530 [Flavisolibacter sp.]|nr:hypothetical protein [Flavisolibacter sp.]